MIINHCFGYIEYRNGWHWRCLYCRSKSETRGLNVYSSAAKSLARHVEERHADMLRLHNQAWRPWKK